MPLSDLIVAGCGTAATALTYYFYNGKYRSIEQIKDAPTYKIDANLKSIVGDAQNNTIPYVTIQGEAKSLFQPIKSQYVAGMVGLIQTLILKEHKTEWSKATRLWHDTSRHIRNTSRHVPFCIEGEDTGSVTVDDPLEASGLDLDTVYDQFQPVESSLGESIVNWASGEKTKGYEEIEKLLPVGTVLTGLGKLSLEHGEVKLGPPTGGEEYILSRLSKSQIIKDMDSKLRISRVLFYVFGTTTVAFILYYIWKTVKKYRTNRAMRRQFELIRRNRQEAQRNGNGSGEENPNAEVCVICLNNPREVVILNCGHICACAECATALQPPQCPICRQRITRTVPVFHA
ncbi:mitochondrial ubiquitin ligase activator of NFKB 1-like [Saccoglossus kowalevskii]|uniref:RING-type E3 ubiquitin transferase n=1 Tax=Saccoglossus kowalevskii TaxID=10224 RepID=A0ABM0GNJ7_SACKO|nr:PREDICTED: mitochondrial ubiquitin ligase activator of NFKB 1-like [Saccoglossus kowalevskii]